MLSFTLSFWLPGAVGGEGLRQYLLWLFTMETRSLAKHGSYGLRVRLCGIGIEIALFVPVSDENEQEIIVSARSVSQNGEEIEVNLSSEAKKWVANLASYGIKMLIGKREMYVDADNSFVMPVELSNVQIDIGDKIMFGDPSDHILVHVTGSRVQEDSSRIFYGRKLAL